MEPDSGLDPDAATRAPAVATGGGPAVVGGGGPAAATGEPATPAAAPAPEAVFAAHRPMLYGLAYRLLGSCHDAQDVLQDAYLRWSATDPAAVRSPRRYLSRIVTRLAVDLLRRRQARRETYLGEWLPEPVATGPSPFGAVDDADLSLAVLHLMERLSPPQRAVYVLRTAFGLPYRQVASIVDLSPQHCRQLYRRAASALQAARPRHPPSRAEHERLLAGFVAAARAGDLPELERMLRADVVAWSDGGGRVKAALRPISIPARVARFFAGIYSRPASLRATPVALNGTPALVVANPRGHHVLAAVVDGGLIAAIYLIANPDKLTEASGRNGPVGHPAGPPGGWLVGPQRPTTPS